MGTSNWQNISYCCDLIHQLAPRRTLDVGIGSVGRWAALIREFVDVWGGRVLPEEWMCTIDGIEAFEPAVHGLHRELYDNIYLGDAYEVIDRLDHYDLIVLGDVIEHFSPERARKMLHKCLHHARFVLVITPLGDLKTWPQDSMYGNPWETHRTIFRDRDFLNSGEWNVIAHRNFVDFLHRDFGVFLLGAPGLGRLHLKR